MRVQEHEQIDGAVAAVLTVIALKLPRLCGDWGSHLSDELGRTLIKANHWSLGIWRFGVEIEHILHAGDVLPVDLGCRYGITAHLICQSFNDVSSKYGDKTPLFDNMHITAAFATSEPTSIEKVTRRAGKALEMRDNQALNPDP